MTYYIGQIELFGGTFAPSGTAFCNGQLLPVQQYDALFSLLGTIYGGDGRTTFGLPDLRGRVAIGDGQGPGLSYRQIGTAAGQEAVSLAEGNIPAHSHTLMAADRAPVTSDNTTLGTQATYAPAGGTRMAMDSHMISSTPGAPAAPHPNMQPYQVLNYIIVLTGIYPSRH